MNDCLTIARQHGGIGGPGVLLWFGLSGLAMQKCRLNRAKALVLLFGINCSGGKSKADWQYDQSTGAKPCAKNVASTEGEKNEKQKSRWWNR
jgi:hypothetical protein